MSPKKQIRVRTISACSWSIEQLPGLSTEEQVNLKDCGILTTLVLLQQTRTTQARIALAGKLQIHLQHINKWVALADLARIPSVGTQYCGLLLHTGIISTGQLAEMPIHRLQRQIMRLQVATMQRRDLCPPVELIQRWSQEAKVIGG
ncbi:DUF4332 domain-containing protein [Calothrix sp. 336/3]|uniref:DUF4332 domain-containing protein n=1 Tax=Calothrix sp. 336/3 TaxID=1337936 RepID=UPI0004E3F2EC|nr:DUF4332 domain-containing protein [Calothrix sp. 336/3]AKG23217.1 hypothetical protein IJ00_19790 [Calothrix sp. 336/3]